MSPLGNLAYRKRVFFMQRKSYILYHPFLLLSKPIDHMMTKLNESTLRARNWLVTDWPTPLSNCPTTYARADFCPFLDQCFDTFQITGMFAINLVDGLKGLAEIYVQYGWHCPLTSFLSSSWEKREQIKLAFHLFVCRVHNQRHTAACLFTHHTSKCKQSWFDSSWFPKARRGKGMLRVLQSGECASVSSSSIPSECRRASCSSS